MVQWKPPNVLSLDSNRTILVDFSDPLIIFGDPKKGRDPSLRTAGLGKEGRD